MDFYSASGIPILWCCFFQTIAIGWIFGVNKFGQCIEQMTGYKPHMYWTVCWAGIAPLVMGVRLNIRTNIDGASIVFFQGIFLSYCISWTPVKYGKVEYPMWAHVIGFTMSLASMLWIPGYAIYYILTQRGSLRDVSCFCLFICSTWPTWLKKITFRKKYAMGFLENVTCVYPI